jgi:hypothetical protein
VFRVEVAKKVRTWGRWLDGHTCTCALGFAATTRRNVEHGHRQVKQGLDPTPVACVRVRVERQRHGNGGHTKLMACTRRGNKGGRTARNGGSNKCYDEDEGTLRFSLGKERRGLWSEFRLGNDELG